MYSLKHKFIVLYIVDLFASSWNPHFLDNVTDKITLYLKARVYTVLARHINRTYDHRNINKYTELLLVTANEQSTTPGNTRVRLTMGTLGTSHWTVISHCK